MLTSCLCRAWKANVVPERWTRVLHLLVRITAVLVVSSLFLFISESQSLLSFAKARSGRIATALRSSTVCPQKSHASNQPTSSHWWNESVWNDRPKYGEYGVCSWIPRNASVASLWNELLFQNNFLPYLQTVLFMNHKNTKTSREVLLDSEQDSLAWKVLLRTLLKPSFLQRAVKSQPHQTTWMKDVLQKIVPEKPSSGGPLRVLVLTTAIPNVGIKDCELDGSESDSCALWTAKLQSILDPSMVRITTLVAPSFATTEFYTERILAQPLFLRDAKHDSDHVPYDVIVHDLIRQDMALTERKHSLLLNVDFAERRLHAIQRFVRAVQKAESTTVFDCTGGSVRGRAPVALFLDDYMGGYHDSILADSIQGRITQQVADHYQLGFISYSRAMQRNMWADGTRNIFGGGAMDPKGVATQRLEQTSILFTVLYSLLSYTVDSCRHGSRTEEDKSRPSFFSPNVQELANAVMPPYLDSNLTLINVKDQWQEEKDAQRERKMRFCVHAD